MKMLMCLIALVCFCGPLDAACVTKTKTKTTCCKPVCKQKCKQKCCCCK